MVSKFFMIILICFFIFILLAGFYFFYFNWYSFNYLPKPQHLNVGLSPELINQSQAIKPHISQVRHITIQDGKHIAWIFIPKNINLNSAPVILFLHGLAPLHPDYTNYYPWLYHEAERGNIVIFPIYQKSFFNSFWPRSFPKIAYKLSKESMARVKKIAPKNDFSRFAIIGISLGGAIATNLVSRDLPQPKTLILLAPGETFPFVPSRIYGVPFGSLNKLNKDCRLTIILGADDHLISRNKIIKKIIHRANKIKEKYIFIIPSDNYGSPVLQSNHLTFFNAISPLTFNGYWKIIDATLSCSFNSKDCDIAEGKSEKALSIGKWSDGREINHIIKISLSSN